MKIDSYFLLLIAFNQLITCNYDVYYNQFSIYFNREIKKINREVYLGDEAINNLLYNNIYSAINIGNKTNPIKLFLCFNNSDINIKLPSKYKNSLEKRKFIFPRTNKELNLSFLLSEQNNEKEGNISYLGLSLNNIDNNKLSFINQLKENKIIEKKIFSVLFKEKSITADSVSDGQILFGLFPHEMTSRYDEKLLNWISVQNEGIKGWEIKFDSVKYYNEESSLNIKTAEFDIGMNLIIGTEEYRNKIYELFFKKRIEDKLCKEEIFFNKRDNQFYIAYSCGYDLDVNDFPTLSFYSRDLNYSIVLDYYQLLCIFERKVFFKVVFKKKAENKKWILGRSFMEVYPLVFDVDNKRIGFYKVEISNDHPFILFLFIVGIFAIIFITVYRGRQMLKKENEQKENERKENIRDNIRGIKENHKNNDTNINNEKSKLKND